MLYSQGFNFDTYAEKGVDPRTGQYTCAIALYEVPSSVRNCPPFNLTLHYNPLNTDDVGLGKGWSFNLTSYEHRTAKTLFLSTGENYRVTELSSGVSVKDQKLKSFLFQKKNTHTYQVIHKSGQIEVLSNLNGVYNVSVPTEIYSANGRSLNLSWVHSGGQPRLSKVQEASQNLVAIDYTDAKVTITRAPGTSEAATFTLLRRNSQLVELQLPLAGTPSWRFTYGTFGLINVTSPAGAVENITYKNSGHLLPKGAPVQAIPYVISHTVRPLQGQPPIVSTYTYSDRNFLGYGGGLDWKDGEDNLYRMPADYEYSSTIQVVGGPTTKYTYNKFHLTVSTQLRQGMKEITQTNGYYALVNTGFDKQPTQYQLPKTVQTTYRDISTGASRTETTEYAFDDWGNPTTEVRPSGITITRDYYPSAGETELGQVLCPADPHGFQRYIKRETVTPAKSAYSTPTRSKRYTYMQLPTAANALIGYLVTIKQLQVMENAQRLSSTEYTYINQVQSRNHSRLQQQVTWLSDQYPTTHAWDYEYVGSEQLRQITSATSYDGHKTHEEERSSLVSGLTLSEWDENGIETEYQYDLMGRQTKTTVSSGTPYQATEQVEYVVLEDAGTRVTTTDGKGVQARYTTDGLERVLRVETQDDDGTWDQYNSYTGTFRVVQERSYNALDQCITETDIDWLRSGNTPTEQRTSRTLEYDDWGQVYKVTKNSGAVHLAITDPIAMTQTVGEEGEGQTRVHLNVFDAPTSEQLIRTNGTVYSTIEYTYDGLGRRMQIKDNSGHITKFTYDSFDRVIETTFPDSHSITTQYAAQSAAILPQSIGLKGTTGFSEQTYDGLDRLTRRTVGGRTSSNVYTGIAPMPTQLTTPKMNKIKLTYEPALDFTLTRRVTSDGVDAYKYDYQTADVVQLDSSFSKTSVGYLPSRLVSHEKIQAKDDSHSSEYVYSQAGKLQGYTDIHGQQHKIQYDSYGRPQSISLGTLKTTLGYDRADRIATSTVHDSKGGLSLSTKIVYDEFGRETQRTVNQGEKMLHQSTQSYGDTGLISGKGWRNGDGSLTRQESFQYDNLSRLVNYQCQGTQLPVDEKGRPIQQQKFTFNNYDGLTRIYTKFSNGSENTATYTYSSKDPTQLTRITNTHPDGMASIDLEYDANGCLTRDEQGRVLVYDVYGRLSAVYTNQNQLVCEYAYDAADRLVSQKVPNEPDTNLYYREDSLIAVKKGDSKTSYVSGGGMYWGQIVQKGATSHAQLWASDAQQSITSWLDTEQPGKVHSQEYTPYGLSLGGTAIGFTGQWRDPVTGWYHLGNGYRVYNPRLMCFHSPDAWSPFVSGEINPYAYCLGDPINRADPSGHFSWRAFTIALVGIAVGITVGILTAGAGVAVGIGISIAAGVVSDVVTGVIYDVASGKSPTWGSVGSDALWGFVGGVAGEAAGRAVAYGASAAFRQIGKQVSSAASGSLRAPLAAITEGAAGSAAGGATSKATTRTATQLPAWLVERFQKGLPPIGLHGGAPSGGKKAAQKAAQKAGQQAGPSTAPSPWTWSDTKAYRKGGHLLEDAHLSTYNDYKALVTGGQHPSQAARFRDLHFEQLRGRQRGQFTIRLSQEHRVAFTIDETARHIDVFHIGGHYPRAILLSAGPLAQL
ncbi:RHS repeat protein [Aspergillus flavus]|uniref:RHS repeat protein n=1 Tax=Aspergillus flavus (strain ATCC 200026 / FGSC A1120 / IAM 13836 / NRRL 3357 / JCM 12722 / SRRC 167) TaxID=332952 RepID=A0A7U2MHM3_ASPFN|nr:uncharacterized protein G4B84_007822 [Aspergillus flavus NRRL3357]KAF7616925.1 hypothetical protein AFLA_004977 [Aspergillus flavus NRRL3357]QMW32391.1 hypothetical protein G4B84_007822 [Aspergillus flavus NRRL3357]QRD83865.1 RHS repeat protein [Aspergillus flavus]